MDKEIEEQIQESFINYLSSLGEKVDIDKMLKQEFDDDEKRIIENIRKEIDMEHEVMADFVRSRLAPEERFEREITELFPDASSEDIKLLKDSLEKGMVKDIELEAKRLKKEIIKDLEKETADDQKLENVVEDEVMRETESEENDN